MAHCKWSDLPDMDCAGIAQRRRRIDLRQRVGLPCRSAPFLSGVALRLPPHSQCVLVWLGRLGLGAENETPPAG